MPMRSHLLPSEPSISATSITRPSAGATTLFSPPGISRGGLRKKQATKTVRPGRTKPAVVQPSTPQAPASASGAAPSENASRTTNSVGRSENCESASAGSESAISVLRAIDQALLLQPGHEVAQLRADLLHRMRLSLLAQRA